MRHLKSKLLALLSLCLLAIYPMAAQTTVQIQVGSITRSMIVYIPQNLPQNMPLIISMHGLNQDPTYQKNMAQLEPIADQEKFSVVYPAGINNSWDLYGTSDIDFILAIIDYMANNYGTDRNRIYLSGFSMGGMMTYYAATKIADKIAAFAPISGYLMSGPNTNSSRPIPIIHTHGTADNVVPYSGVQPCINAWVIRNGNPATAVVTNPYPVSNPNSHCTKSYWGPGTNGVEIVLMTLEGKGHWISNDPINGISTSQEIWNFCKQYSLNNCTPTTIVPYMQINDGAWQQTSSITVNSGDKVKFGPQPTSGGSWSWSGCGTSGTSREQTVYPTSSCTSTAIYTNSCGAQSTQNFNISIIGSTTELVNNGIYTIEFQTDANTVIDLMNGSDANGTAIRPWTKNGATAQQWIAISAGTNLWRFKSNASASGRVIDLNGGNTANGTTIQLWDNYNNDAQAWLVTSVGNGYYKIASKLNTSRGWDVPNCVIDGSQNLHLWDYYGTSCQLFKFNYVSLKSASEQGFNPEIEQPNFKIYPNPSTNGNFTIALTDLQTENSSVCVYNLQGQKVYENANLSKGINSISSGLTRGVFIIQVSLDNSVFYEKITVQ